MRALVPFFVLLFGPVFAFSQYAGKHLYGETTLVGQGRTILRSDGRLTLGGTNTTIGSRDVGVVKVPPAATLLWQASAADFSDEYSTARYETSDGGIVATGSTLDKVASTPTPGASGTANICFGQSATIAASGGNGYLWSTGDTTAVITVTPSTTTWFYVTVTNNGLCAANDSVLVVVAPLPNANAGMDVTICENTTTTLVATGGVGYMWSDGATTASNTVAPTTTTSYVVTVTGSNGCTALSSVTVNVLPAPTASAGGNINHCLGSMSVLTATGGASYAWDTGDTTASAIVSPTTPTDYTVTVTAANGCTATAIASVQVFNTPAAGAGADQVVCAGDTVYVMATGGGTYAWSTGTTTASDTIVTLNDTIMDLSITVTNAVGCAASDTMTLTVNAVPVAAAGPDTTICFGDTATLTASGGIQFQWSNGDPTVTSLVSPPVTTGYAVTVTNVSNCSATDFVIVTVNPLPVADAGADAAYCFGDSAWIVATGGGAYLWSTGDTLDSVQVAVTVPNAYAVTVTSGFGCAAADSVTINVNDVPMVNVVPTDVDCHGDSTGAASAMVAGGTSPFSYLWSNSATGMNPTGFVAGSYLVTVVDANGCLDTASVTIAEPAVLGVGMSSIDATCGNADGTATATVSGGTSPYTYAWTPSGSAGTITGLTIGPYHVDITDANGCTISDSVTVSDNSNVVATITASTPVLCANDSNATATVSASGGMLPYTYQWSNGEIGAVATSLHPGFSSVTVTDNGGCSAQASVWEANPPILEVVATSTDATCANADGTAAAIASGGTGAISYLWSSGDAQAGAQNLMAGSYTVVVTDSNGCTASDTVLIDSPGAPELLIDSLGHIACGDTASGYASVSTISGTPPYTYTWSGGLGGSPIQTSLSAGLYALFVTDSNGCTDGDTLVIMQQGGLMLSVTTTDPQCAATVDGSATVQASGGMSPYTYSWSSGELTQTTSGLGAGNYVVTVTDDAGCTGVDSGTVVAPALLSVATSSTDQTMLNPCNGTATVTVSGGVTPYTYLWSDGAGQTTAEATDLCSALYSCTVTDANGCVVGGTVEVQSAVGLPGAAVPISTAIVPNPNSGQFQLLVNAPAGGSGQLRIVNALGQALRIDRFNVVSGNNRLPIHTPRLAAGVYFLILETEQWQTTHRLVIE